MSGKQLIKLLIAYGFRPDRIKGSYHILVKDGCRSIPVPVHGQKDLPIGPVKAILKQAGLNKG